MLVPNVSEANTCYQNLPNVSRVFKDCISLRVLQKYREGKVLFNFSFAFEGTSNKC